MSKCWINILVLLLCAGVLAPVSARSTGKTEPKKVEKLSIPTTGNPEPAMADFDLEMQEFMKKWELPGGALAIVRKGKLVYARGYGYANKEEKRLVQPDSIFRIASVSKVITAVAALKLIQDGKIDFETKAFPLLDLPQEKDPTRRMEERVNQISIRHLLEGTAGWDRNAAGDPMFMPIAQQAAIEYSNSLRPTARAIIRYEACRRLDFEPGTRFCYSNLGYSILGEVIAKVSGKKYEQYVQDEILAPMGLKMYRGRTRNPYEGEVHYYGYDREQVGPSILPNVRGYLPLEYGGDFYLEAMTADCGWASSVPSVANFVSCLFAEQGKEKQVLSTKLVRTMLLRPALVQYVDSDKYHGMAWELEDSKSGETLTISKVGSLPGTHALVVHKLNGTTVAVAFNTRPKLMLYFQEETLDLIKKMLKSHQRWLKTNN